MKSARLGVALLICALLLAPPLDAATRAFHTEYSVTVRGFPVGHAQLQAEFDDGHYTIQFSGGVQGLARLFSDAETSAAAVGEVVADQLEPDEYKHLWREDNETEAVDMHFVNRHLTELNLDPPIRHPERYVPLTTANTADVLDPVSAFVWPVSGGMTPDICRRTLPLLDGKRRFDIALAFNRTETFATRDGSYTEPAVVCTFRYEQVAGHRIGKTTDDSINNGQSMEVWMTPAGAGLVAPARIEFSTRIGRVILLATKFEAD